MTFLLSYLLNQSSHSYHVAHTSWYGFPTLSHSVALNFSSRVFCTFCHWAYNFSTSHLGFSFWNLRFYSF